MHGCQCSIFFDTCLDPHFDRMTPTMGQKDLFTGTGDFDWPASSTRQFSSAHFMRKGVAFATETAANMWSYYPYMRLWQTHHLAQFSMHIVGSLRRGPEREFATKWIIWIWLPVRYTRMCLHWGMIIPLIEEP